MGKNVVVISTSLRGNSNSNALAESFNGNDKITAAYEMGKNV